MAMTWAELLNILKNLAEDKDNDRILNANIESTVEYGYCLHQSLSDGKLLLVPEFVEKGEAEAE